MYNFGGGLHLTIPTKEAKVNPDFHFDHLPAILNLAFIWNSLYS
jgi:hypothetical protein